MSRVRKCADCGRFCNRLYDVPCNPSCNGIDREVCERCAPHAGAAVENNQPPPQHEITERGRAVVESGLSVRQAHEIETGCSEDNPCANCRRYVTVRDALLDEARAAGSLVAEEYLTGIRLRDGTPGGHMSAELVERLDRANKTLLTMAEEAPLKNDRIRLQGKAEGVRLALSYIREMGDGA